MFVENAAKQSTRSAKSPASCGEIRSLIAETLDIDEEEVAPSLSLHDVPEWSSLDHVTLMLALEDRFGYTIEGSLIAELASVGAIERFVLGDRPLVPHVSRAETTNGTYQSGQQSPTEPSNIPPTIYRGLDGVHFDESAITSIDGLRGELLIRGYSIEDLAASVGFVEMCHLVLYGELPTGEEEADTRDRLLSSGPLPSQVAVAIGALAGAHPMIALRTALSMLGQAGSTATPSNGRQIAEAGLELVAGAHRAIALHNALRAGQTLGAAMDFCERSSDAPGHSISDAFLRQYFRSEPTPIEVEALDLVWALGVEHGSNASTFAARVAAASGTDLYGAVVSALSTFGGPLHGGAIEGVIEGLREIGSPENAAAYVEDRRARRLPIMGYGHRVYKVMDPRAPALRAMACRLAEHRGDRWAVDTMSAVEVAMAPYGRAGLSMNVDSYSAVTYHLLGFPDDMFTTLYALTRMTGWVAHVAEQVDRNVLIRPRLAYVGPERRSLVGKAAR